MAPGYAIVTPAGELDIATAPQLRECLLAFLPARPALVVDLNQVSFCDATGLGVLAGAANRARASGTSLHLVCSRTDIRRLFELTGLTRRLPLARTLDEVQAALTLAQAAPARNSRAARRATARPTVTHPAPPPARDRRPLPARPWHPAEVIAMTAQPEHLPSLTTRPTSAPGMASPASAPAGVPALLSPVPCPGTPPGTTVPGVLAAAGVGTGGRIVRVTRLAHAAPGKPDGEVDTRPLVPLWKQARRDTHTGPAHQQ